MKIMTTKPWGSLSTTLVVLGIAFLLISQAQGIPSPYSNIQTNCSYHRYADGLESCKTMFLLMLKRFKHDYSGVASPYLHFCCEYPYFRKCVEDMLVLRCGTSEGSDFMIYNVLTKDIDTITIGDPEAPDDHLDVSVGYFTCDGEEFYFVSPTPVCWSTLSLTIIGILILIILIIAIFVFCCCCCQLAI